MQQELKFTLDDLKHLQGLPLEVKIQKSIAKILEWYARNDGRVFVSYSGGKDSSVLLHLVRQILSDVPAVFVNTGLEYPEVVQHVKNTENVTILRPKLTFRAVIEKCGYPVVSKDIANMIDAYRRRVKWAHVRMSGAKRQGTQLDYLSDMYERWRFLIDAPFKISDKCCEVIKEKPLERYTRAGEMLPIVGTLASESRRRTTGWLRSGCNAFDGKHPRSAPLSFWTEDDILRYIKQFNIPIASVYGEIVETKRGYKTTGIDRTGCMFCLFGCHLEKQPNRFQRMAETHPKLYEYCMRDWDANGLGLRAVMDYIGISHEPIKEGKSGQQNDTTTRETGH